MRHLRTAAIVCALALGGCLGPPSENGTTAGGESSSTSTSTTSTSTTTSATTGGSTGQTTGSSTSATTGGGSTGTSSTSATTTSATNTSSTTTNTSTTTVGTGGTSGTSGTTGTCAACSSDADCAPVSGATVTCTNSQCLISYPPDPSSAGTTGGMECATTGGSSGTTGTNACACSSDADCAPVSGATVSCTNAQCVITYPPSPSSGGTSGGVECATTGGSGSTGGTSCTCTQDSDCNDAYHIGYVCSGGVCTIGPNAGAASSTGGACANGGSSSTTTGSGSTSGGSSTPLVLDFGGAPVKFTQASGRFELGQGEALSTDWVDASTPWLALDRDGDGRIGSGAELFGSLTRLPDGSRAKNGFQALRALDANHDGRIDAQDPAFAHLRVWRDLDQDRKSSPNELTSLAQSGVVAIELGYRTSERCDVRGNCEREHARLVYRDAQGRERSGEVIDVHLAHRQVPAAVVSAR